MKRKCPGCPNTLSRFSLKGKDFYACADHGFLAGAGAVQAFFKDRDLAEYCLSRIAAPAGEFRASERLCPMCARGFLTFVTKTFSFVHVDVCQRCHAFWFDQGEWEQVKDAGYHASIPEAEAARIKRSWRKPKERGLLEVEEGNFADMFMFSEESKHVKARSPIVTYMFAAFALMATAFARREPALFMKWAFFPEHPFANLGVRNLTSLAVHGDLLHWLGNALFLTLVGDDCEDEVGHWEFIKLFVLSGFAGHLAYMATGATQPSVGMNGAVAGLMAYYGIRFPQNRIRKTIPFRPRHRGPIFFRTLSISSRGALGLYVVITAIGLVLQLDGGGNGANYAAHAGGLVFGALYAWTRA